MNLQNERPKRPCEFTFTWFIHNYGSCTTKENERIESSYFGNLDGNSKWALCLYPRGYHTPGFLGCYLGDRTEYENIQFTLSICNSKGQFKEGLESIYNTKIDTNGIAKLVCLEEEKCPNSYLVNDTLTIRCRMWNNDVNNPLSGSCDFHSRINASKPNSEKPEALMFRAMTGLEGKHSNKLTLTTDVNKVWSKNMEQCYKNGKFSDFVIHSPGRQFPINRSILAAHSEVFEAMFERDMKERNSGMVNIEDVEDDTVSRMLMYIYTNTIDDIDISSAQKLYVAADKYRITALQKKCSDFLKECLEVSNVCDILELANAYQDEDLERCAKDLIYANVHLVMKSESWKKLKQTNVQLICEIQEWMIFNVFSI